MQSKLSETTTKKLVNITLPGKPMSILDLKTWLKAAEQSETITLEEALDEWQRKKGTLRTYIK